MSNDEQENDDKLAVIEKPLDTVSIFHLLLLNQASMCIDLCRSSDVVLSPDDACLNLHLSKSKVRK